MSAGIGRQRRRLDLCRVELWHVFLYVLGPLNLNDGFRLRFPLLVVLLDVLRQFTRLLWLGFRFWLGCRLRGLPLCHLARLALDGLVADFLGLVGHRLGDAVGVAALLYIRIACSPLPLIESEAAISQRGTDCHFFLLERRC